MKIVITPKWMMPFGYGLTIWKLALVREDSSDIAYVIAHEAEHVRQWTSIGMFKFPYLYVKELIKNGYKNNKYEIQARHEGTLNAYKYVKYTKD